MQSLVQSWLIRQPFIRMLCSLRLGDGDLDGIFTLGLPDIKVQRASGRKTSGRGDLYSRSFSKEMECQVFAHFIYTSISRLGIEPCAQLLCSSKSSSAATAICIMSSNIQVGIALSRKLSIVDPGPVVSPLAIHALVIPISLHGT